MRRAFQLGVGLLLCAACRKPDAPRPRAETTNRAPTAQAPSTDLLVASDVQVSGLHVKSGSLAARGSRLLAAAPAFWGFSDLAIDSAKLRLEIELRKGGAPLARLLPVTGLAVVNGGYFEADFRPSTWLKNAGIELSPRSDTSKGGVLALGEKAVYLGPFAALSFEPRLAVQSFPLVVEQDGRAGIHSDDGQRAARTVACLVGDILHLIVISAPRGDGPTLFESSALMRKAAPGGFGCRVALNLDGGPSSGVWFAPQVTARQRAPLANVGYAIAILPR
jgi:hypothetical protein